MAVGADDVDDLVVTVAAAAAGVGCLIVTTVDSVFAASAVLDAAAAVVGCLGALPLAEVKVGEVTLVGATLADAILDVIPADGGFPPTDDVTLFLVGPEPGLPDELVSEPLVGAFSKVLLGEPVC